MSQKIDQLIQTISQSQTNTSAARAETQLITHILSISKLKIVQAMNSLIHDMPDSSFQHVFGYLISDEQFFEDYQNQLIQWIAHMLKEFNQGLTGMSSKKKLMFMDFLLNAQLQSTADQTLITSLITSACRTDLCLCHSLISTVNQFFAQLHIEKLDKYDINELTVLCIRVIKGFSKLPAHLIDEAFRFVSLVLLPKTLSLTDKVSQEFIDITGILLQKTIEVLSTQKYTIGNAYRFLGTLLYYEDRLGLFKDNGQLVRMVKLCANNFSKIFPNLANQKPNALQTQIQKLHQYYIQKDLPTEANQSEKNQLKQTNISNQINLNNQLELLRGCSFYLNQFFMFCIQDKRIDLMNEVIQQLPKDALKIYQKTSQLLAYCNDREMFCNFIETHCKQEKIGKSLGVDFSLNDEQLMKQIVENCPNPIEIIESGQRETQTTPAQSQQNQVLSYLKTKLTNIINQGNLSKLLDIIGQNIQQQYDHAFSTAQFESACNTLTLIFKITQESSNLTQKSMELEGQTVDSKLKATLSKDDIIEWIKTMLNLNESCLPKFRRLIVAKTYQLLAQVFQVILPGNQYLQEVIQEELITKSFPYKKNVLDKLIEFYEKTQGQIFESGFKNKLEFNRYSAQFNQLFSKNHQIIVNEDSSIIQQKQSTFTNRTFRKWKLLERVFKKLQDRELDFKDVKYLWNFTLRVYGIGGNNDGIDISVVRKLFLSKPKILFARHLTAVQSQDLEIKHQLSLTIKELQEIDKEFRKNPIFYHEELTAIRNPSRSQIQ